MIALLTIPFPYDFALSVLMGLGMSGALNAASGALNAASGKSSSDQNFLDKLAIVGFGQSSPAEGSAHSSWIQPLT